MTQQLMTPTCPITTWSPLRRTFWTESPWALLVSPQLLVLLLFTGPCLSHQGPVPACTEHGSAARPRSAARARGLVFCAWVGAVLG